MKGFDIINKAEVDVFLELSCFLDDAMDVGDKTQQWPRDWKRSVFIPIPKKGNAKECSNYRTIALISHARKVDRKSVV